MSSWLQRMVLVAFVSMDLLMSEIYITFPTSGRRPIFIITPLQL